MDWLLEQQTRLKFEAMVKAGFRATAQETASFVEMSIHDDEEDSAPATVNDGKTGVIQVEGVLTPKPDFWAFLFGGGNTTYSSITKSLRAFEADANIENITMEINSPGGSTAGLFEVFEVMKGISKPITARVGAMAASAAFGLATQADRIEASGPASMVGSVGVVQSFFIEDDVIDITSTNAPNKRPDVTTKEGKEVVVSYLDDIHELFASAIADGRGTTVKDVNTNFGRGGIVLAAKAVETGMIDCICEGAFNITESKAADAGTKTSIQEISNMDINKLKAEFPALYEAVKAEGRAEGVISGTASELDRVTAHLTYGLKGNCMDIASEAIEKGTEVTQALTAKYMTAAQDVANQDLRATGDTEAHAALDLAANGGEEIDTLDQQTAALYAAKYEV